ncbi:MAG: transcriptional regulator domain-containing protein [Bradyrhizobium sp.]|uniref:transcriptional regulator domain-containing protein n=1 Tax=Bradyrhizobium TaxID=374 RepID=UPI0028EED6D9|nr:DUF6499 domain-containing protein [Bradyrhizobium viridifuturi]
MRPDISNWRDDRSYDFFDTLPIEGLAWECLRRYQPYQSDYASLVDTGAGTRPLPDDMQQRWGLRFPRKTKSFRRAATGGVVVVERPRCPLSDNPAGLSPFRFKQPHREIHRGA